MIPGGNILGMAFNVITPQCVGYRPYIQRTLNDVGVWEAQLYGSPVQLRGSLQPVPRTRYEVLGLDFQKNYVTLFIERGVIDIARDVAGDEFAYAGKLYHAESKTPWFAQDGWDSVLAVEVTKCTVPLEIPE